MSTHTACFFVCFFLEISKISGGSILVATDTAVLLTHEQVAKWTFWSIFPKHMSHQCQKSNLRKY